MQDGYSRPVCSNQTGAHEDLVRFLNRHRDAEFRKPLAQHTRQAFAAVRHAVAVSAAPIVLDSGCGTGRSTLQLAAAYPGHLIIGIDKSSHRLLRSAQPGRTRPENVLFVRANLIDFWRLAAAEGWEVDRHYLLYPNPWPKRCHLMRRFHAHPVFFQLMQLGRYFELRSNWEIYLAEFSQAVAYLTGRQFAVQRFQPAPPYLTLFEQKYARSGQALYRLIIELDARSDRPAPGHSIRCRT